MPGARKSTPRSELIGIRLPDGVYEEMIRIIEGARQWPAPARQNFILEAVKEKLDRWKREHPLGPPRVRAEGKG